MSRNLRQDPIDGWHHVTNHAVSSEDLFRVDTDRYQFIRRMHEGGDKFGVAVVAFVLMGNHFHLLLHCPTGGLSGFMHYLESIYAREFNVRHGRRHSLFGCEFHNTLVATDGQAAATIRYIHRNPLELGIDIRSYPWSSYLAYVRGHEDLLRVDPAILEELLDGPHTHRQYVETDFPTDELKMSMGVRKVYRAAPMSLERDITTLCAMAAAVFGTTVAEIVAPRVRVRNDARLAVALIAYESRTGFGEELRILLGYNTGATLRSAVRRSRTRAESDAQFREILTELRVRWAGTALRQAG